MTQPISPLALNARHALFLDFDGTLAPIQDDPETVWLPDGGAETLMELARRLDGALAIISGRDVRDLSRRVPGGLWRIGGHGLEVCAPGEAPPETRAQAPRALCAAIGAAVAGLDGVRIEPKGAVLAIHYRAAPSAAPVLAERLGEAVSVAQGYSLQHGKMVFEAKPDIAHKGTALANMMQRAAFAGRVPVMVGDDVTDEDAMEAALSAGGSAIKVGEGDTRAPFRLAAPDEIWAWLKGHI